MVRTVLTGFVLTILMACEARLSEDQRRQIAEARKKQEIRQVPEAEILQGGLRLGEQLITLLPDSADREKVNQVAKQHGVTIRWAAPDQLPPEPLMQDLIHAYVFALKSGQNPDYHIQRLGVDSVLFVMPAIGKDADSEKVTLRGIWDIRIPVKKIVLEQL